MGCQALKKRPVTRSLIKDACLNGGNVYIVFDSLSKHPKEALEIGDFELTGEPTSQSSTTHYPYLEVHHKSFALS